MTLTLEEGIEYKRRNSVHTLDIAIVSKKEEVAEDHSVKSLPNNKIMDSTKLKAFADDKLT